MRPDLSAEAPADHAGAAAPRRRTPLSLLWSLLEAFGSTGLSIVATLVLARCLTVEQLGTGALAVLIAQLAALPLELLFHDTLIQQRRLTPVHDATAFATVGVLASALALALALLAPGIGQAFGNDALASLLPLAATAVPLAAVSAVAGAMLRRTLSFAPLARRTLVGRSLGIGMGMAAGLAGWGAVSMVVLHVAGTALSTAILLADRRHWPTARPSAGALREMLQQSLLNMVGQLLVIGNSRIFLALCSANSDAATFGRLSLAFKIVEDIRTTINAALHQLALPLLARQRDSRAEFQRIFVAATRFSAALMLPLFAGFAVLAPAVVASLLGPRWQGTEPLVQWLCVAAMVMVAFQFSGTALTALVRPLSSIRINAVAVLASTLPVLAGLVQTGEAAVIAWLLRALCMMLAACGELAWQSSLHLGLQLRPLQAPLLASAVMAACLLLLGGLPTLHAPWLALGSGVAVGAVVYLCVIALTAPSLLVDLRGFLRPRPLLPPHQASLDDVRH